MGVDRGFERIMIIIRIQSIGRSHGMNTKIVARHQRVIRKEGKTAENVEWIKTVYPGYLFKKDASGNLHHEVLILEMSPGHAAS